MKKLYQIIGLIVLIVASAIYDYKEPEYVKDEVKASSFVILEGEFLRSGRYEFVGDKNIQSLINEVGVSSKANLKALFLEKKLIDEERIYLPAVNDHCISLNKATLDELKTLKGVGNKTAEKIISYRQEHMFTSLEQIMEVKGIGEKMYLRLRDELCL